MGEEERSNVKGRRNNGKEEAEFGYRRAGGELGNPVKNGTAAHPAEMRPVGSWMPWKAGVSQGRHVDRVHLFAHQCSTQHPLPWPQ